VRRTTNRARSHRCIPTLTFPARTPTAVESILDPLNEGGEASTVATVEALVVEYARDARKYLVACDKLLRVFSSSNELMVEVACAGIRAASFSPNGRYIVTFQRPHKNEEGIVVPNLAVWRGEGGASVLALNQKELDKDHWPWIQFTADESHCVRQVTKPACARPE